jgi:hypothetical protein
MQNHSFLAPFITRLGVTAAGLALCFGLATPVSAQIAVGAKAGSAGFGVDAGLSIFGPLSLRVGLGVTDVLSLDPAFSVDDLTYELKLPTSFVLAGVDLRLLGPLGVSGGFLLREGDLGVDAELTGSQTVGGTTYTETGTLSGTVKMNALAPYLAVSVGHLAARGIGFFAMAGAAFAGEPTVALTAAGPITLVDGFSQSLETARQEAQDQIPGWLKVYPLVQVGVRLGF